MDLRMGGKGPSGRAPSSSKGLEVGVDRRCLATGDESSVVGVKDIRKHTVGHT